MRPWGNVRPTRPRSAFLLRLGLVAAMLLGVTAVVGTPPARAALPAGFTVRDLPSGQSDTLTDFAFLPDGSYFTIGKNGRVAWVSATGTPVTVATLPVVNVQDLGLTGLAVAPDYATSKRIYLARTMMVNNAWTMRLASWTVTGTTPTALTGERVLWDMPAGSDVHAITGIVAAADGTLWVSIGDSADFRFVDPQALRALDLTTGYGKVVHVRADGTGVPTNPFYDAAAPGSWKSRVYASGFRSPFRLSLDPTTGAPVLGDVGWNTWEEVDVIRPGASYGWPCWEGNTRTPGYADLAGCQGVGNSAPLWTYVHGPLGTSVTGGVVYTGSAYPAAYQGAYFWGDYASARVYTLRYDAQGRLTRQPEDAGFGTGNGAPVKFALHPTNSDVVWADIGGATLKRLSYAAGNRAPTASATISTNPATRTVTFDGRGSSDLDGDQLTYSWAFGDGATATGAQATHTYPDTATRTATLTVRDPQGATGTSTLTVAPANNVPVITLTAPPADRRFAVGETIAASAAVTDAEDGGGLSLTWNVVLVHCSGGYCHNHPGETVSGPTFSRAFDDHGDDTRLDVTVTATDSAGVRAQKTFSALPRLRTLTVGASTPAAITVNGVARATAQITAGARVSIIAPTVAADGVSTFDRWNDGGVRERTQTMPDSDLTITATYVSPIDQRYNNEAALRTLLGAPTAPEAGDAAVRWRTYANGRLYWSPATGAHEVHGAILTKYLARGGHVAMGVPGSDEQRTADGVGRFTTFAGANVVYWSSSTGAQSVVGDIATLWGSLGSEKGPNGYPRSDELVTPDGRGRYNNFVNGGIYWLPTVGARSVVGAIYTTWGRLGYERGILGFPTTNETRTPDGAGRYNHFENGSVYWTSRTGAHEVHGAIRTRWGQLGWERSYLGYPTSDEFAVPGGRRVNFEHGYITWTAATGAVRDVRV